MVGARRGSPIRRSCTTAPAVPHGRAPASCRAARPASRAARACVASSDDPIAGGRHKVWGSRRCGSCRRRPPSPRTCRRRLACLQPGPRPAARRARRLPRRRHRAVLVRRRVGQPCHARRRRSTPRATRVPAACPAVLFVCEDNGTGISVPTPRAGSPTRSGTSRTCAISSPMADLTTSGPLRPRSIMCRRTRHPAFLHLRTVRLWGTPAATRRSRTARRTRSRPIEARDPLLRNARSRWSSPARRRRTSCCALVDDTRERVMAAAEEAARRPRLETTAQVMAPLAPDHPSRVGRARSAPTTPDERRRRSAAGRARIGADADPGRT